jgi:hypothetical protein
VDVGPRLATLTALLARRYGPTAARKLSTAARTWLADPANEPKQRALEAQLRGWADTAGGMAAALASRLAAEVDRRSPAADAWERDLMALRADLADAPRGPDREAALRAYVARTGVGARIVFASEGREEARRKVLAALDAEAGMLRRERLSPEEREACRRAVDRARAACYGAAAARGGEAV